MATSAYAHTWVEFTSLVEIYKTSDLGTMIDSGRPFDLSVDTGGAFGRFELEDHVGYTYTNNTGVSQRFTLGISSKREKGGADLGWSAGFTVTGGDPYDPPGCPNGLIPESETFGSNRALCDPCASQQVAADPVDTRTGNQHMGLPGIEVGGRGPGLGFSLAYNSLASGTDGPVGHGWSSLLDMAVVEDGTAAVVEQEGGSTVPFELVGGVWTAPPRFTAELEELSGGGWVFTRNHFETFTFDAAGRLVAMGDQFDNVVTIVRDGGGVADYMQDGAGRRLDFEWDGGRLVSVSDDRPALEGGERSVQFAYDTNGDLVSYTDVGGGVWSFTYDGAHRLLTMRKPRHQGGAATAVVTNTYDHLGRVATQTNEEGEKVTFEYFTPVPGATTITMASGRQKIDFYDHDGSGVHTATVVAPGTAQEATTTFVRDPATLALVSVTHPDSQVTTFDNDGPNRTMAMDPSGRVTRWTYNSFDQVTSVSVGETAAPLAASTAEVVTSTMDYDSLGRLVEVVDAVGTPDEATTTFEYDPARPDDLVKVVDARAKEWTYAYDADTGDLLEALDPEGGLTTFGYNGIGWVTSVVAPKGHVSGAVASEWTSSFEHDDWGRVVVEVDPLGNRVRTDFDPNGNVESVETGLSAAVTTGDVTVYGYDDADRLTTVDPPGPGERTYTYDDDGRRIGFVNELNAPADGWTYTYDDLGRLESQTDPANATTTYGYDEASRLATVTQPGSGSTCSGTKVNCVTYAYDLAGRPTGVDYSDPATPDVTGIVYDALGRRIEATRAGDTEVWGWDDRSRLVSHVDVNGRTTTYGWDDGSNLVSIGYPGQSTPLTRSFDDAGRLESVTDWASRTTTFNWDENGNWEQTVFPTSSQNTDVYAYDRADRLVGVTWKRATTTLGSLTYAPRDEKGLVTAVTGAGTAAGADHAWDYDTRDRLTETGVEEFGFDAATNLIDADGVLQVFDPAQRLCWTSETVTSGDCATPAADATTFGFDERGNRTSMTYPSGTTAAYGFDAENRMTTAELPTGSGNDEFRQFVTLTPARIADTTTATGTCDGSPCDTLAANDPVAVTVAGQGGVPATGATAVALTVTVTDPVGDGWLTINPTTTDAAAGVAALVDGQATSVNVVAMVDTNGAITLNADVAAEVAVDVTGYFKTPSIWVPALNYWPVTPTLAAESGDNIGVCDGAPCDTLPAGETDIAVAGVGGIPTSGVAAVTVAVIAQNPTAGGRLRAAPNGDASAGDIAWDTGSVGASGNFTVPVNGDGTITVETEGATDIRLAVTGYWKLPAANDTGLGLELLDAPARLVDTTAGTGLCSGETCTTLAANESVEIPVAGEVGLDADIAAVMVAVTVIDPAATGLVGISPDGVDYPGLVLFDAGQNVSASMIVPVDPATGTITVLSWAATDLAIDVIGSFTRPTRTWRYHYDTAGLRTAKELETSDGAGIEWRKEHTWTATGGLPLLLAEHQGTASTYVIYGPGGTPIYQINTTGEVIYLHQDHQGSTRLVTNANGTTRGAMTYDTHGTITANTNPWILQQPLLGYSGQYHDTETGYIYLRARHYDPATGQFTSLDPLVAITEEPYGYVYGNPANGSDPLGMCLWDLCVVETTTLIVAVGLLVAGGTYVAVSDQSDLVLPSLPNFWEPAEAVHVDRQTQGLMNFEAADIFPSAYCSSGKNGAHGDDGRELSAAKIEITLLQAELAVLTSNQGPKKEKDRLKKKIERLRKSGERARKGVNHSQNAKGNG